MPKLNESCWFCGTVSRILKWNVNRRLINTVPPWEDGAPQSLLCYCLILLHFKCRLNVPELSFSVYIASAAMLLVDTSVHGIHIQTHWTPLPRLTSSVLGGRVNSPHFQILLFQLTWAWILLLLSECEMMTEAPITIKWEVIDLGNSHGITRADSTVLFSIGNHHEKLASDALPMETTF